MDFGQHAGSGSGLVPLGSEPQGEEECYCWERGGAVMTFKTRSTGTYELDQDLKKPEVTC